MNSLSRLFLMLTCSVFMSGLMASARADEASKTEKKIGISVEKPSRGYFVKTDQGYMIPYMQKIPGTDVSFEMIPIPGNEFLFGSPTDEANRKEGEGPQVRVTVPPCWVAKCEVTWAEYKAYMYSYSSLKGLNEMRVELRRFGDKSEKLDALPTVKKYLQQEALDVDSVTAPTPLYDPDTTFSSGQEPNHPAVTMRQFAAKQYTKWLSGITGQEYRLPTEAEWEYAARAGTTTPYGFAADKSLEDYAWFEDNSDDQLQAVGTKLPNAWGLHDMHGNVAEWVLDEYSAKLFIQLNKASNTAASNAADIVFWPTQLYPRVIRGGCWFDGPAACRSAARHKSDDLEWLEEDPNLPKSPWWFTEYEASGVGFRVLRQLAPMDVKLKKKVWDADIEEIELDVADRLRGGRGTRTSANVQLPAAIQELKEAGLVE